MGSGSYSFAAYSALSTDRGYATKSADAVFTNHTLSAKSDIKLSNVIAEAIKQHEDLTGIPYEAQAVAPTTSVGEESGTYTY